MALPRSFLVPPSVLACAGLLAVSVMPSPASAGEIGKALEGLGKVTGLKPIKRAGEEAERAWDKTKKEIPVIQDIQHLTSDQVRDAGRWTKDHPEEVLAIAAVVAVGWAACVDGCTLIAGIALEGVEAGGAAAVVPLAAMAIGDTPDDGSGIRAIPSTPTSNDDAAKLMPDDAIATSAPAAPTAAPPNSAEQPASPSSPIAASAEPLTSAAVGNGSEIVQVPGAPGAVVATSTSTVPYLEQGLKAEYPRYISLADTGSGAPTIVYRSLDERLPEATNQFSVPVYPALVRLPNKSDDPAGGTFLSRRNDLGSGADASAAFEAFGTSARRIHGGIDFLAVRGQPIMAPLSGKIGRVDIDAGHNLKGIEIVSEDGTKTRVLYVVGSRGLRVGQAVVAGQTRIGTAADISGAYRGVVNHVHVDFTDIHGRRFDPWTNTVVDPRRP